MMGHIEGAFAERTRSEERLRQFVGDASHELRTPITTIRGYAELYRDGGLTREADLAEAMRRTEQEAIRMGTLVDDLLHLARLDQGRPLERGPVDVGVLVRDAVADARAVDPLRPMVVTSDDELVVTGDEGRLHQVLGNLVTNALVHTEPGTAVAVDARRDGADAVVRVTDSGDGMPPEVAARVFERFYRADASRARHRGGSGLGLAIVEATVVAHGGTVAVDSSVGRGTTFTVRLPISG
jgi:two-component system OmpR family sensor kinase